MLKRSRSNVALQLGAVRNAFLAAGTPSDQAEAAAEDLANYDNRLADVHVRLERLVGSIRLVQ